MDQRPQPRVGELPKGKNDAGEEDGYHDDDKEETGAAPRVVFGLDAHVLHRQLQPLFITEDRLVLRTMVRKDPEKKLRKQKRQSATPFRKNYGNFFMNWTGTNIFSCLQRR